MPFIPNTNLKKLYNHSSLTNTDNGVCFSMKNRLSPVSLEQIHHVALDGQPIPGDRVTISFSSGAEYPANQINPDNPVDFPLASLLTFHLSVDPLDEGKHDLELVLECQPFGRLELEVSDSLKGFAPVPGEIPRDRINDYSEAIIHSRQEFIRSQTGSSPNTSRSILSTPAGHRAISNISRAPSRSRWGSPAPC